MNTSCCVKLEMLREMIKSGDKDRNICPFSDNKTLPADTDDCKTLRLKHTLNLH